MSTLILVPTPLGNLGDLSTRAAELIKTAAVVACEDTRVTRKILAHLGSRARLVSIREANEESASRRLLDDLAAGIDVIYCTDAGTPGISDPGRILVRRAIEAGVAVQSIPGPSAVTTALALSGLPADRFLFAGFLPSDRRGRRRELERLIDVEETIVLFESPHRMNAFLEDAAEYLGGREIVICRELTKLHEEITRGVIGGIPPRDTWRGEITVVIEGRPAGGQSGEMVVSEEEIRRRIANDLATGMGVKEAARTAAKIFGISAREAYSRALNLKK